MALSVLQEKLKRVTDATVIAMRPELLNIEAFKGQRVAVYCGIGRPERFVEALGAAGVECAESLNVLDHQLATETELSQFVKKCRKKGIDRILCTMKDWVKLSEEMRKTLPLSPVGMELKIFSGEEHWDALLKTIVDRT
jgi:tetraacyldisaccharide 4'-kinase